MGTSDLRIGVDMGGTKIMAAVVDPDGNILARAKKKTKPERGPEKGVDRIADTVHLVLDTAEIPMERIAGIGIGIPGILDPDSGVLFFAPNLPGWTDVPVRDSLAEKLGLPVVLDNDVTLGALGEATVGAAREVSHSVSISIGTGIGAGILIGGEVYRGFNQTAGEIGHMVVEFSGPKCECGTRGCLEAVASRTAIEREIRTAIKNGAKSVIPDLLGKKSNAPIKSGMLKRAVDLNDEVTIQVLEKAAQYLGIGVLNIVHLFSPEMVVLGGGVMASLGDRLLPIVDQTARKFGLEGAFQNVQIVLASLKDDAVVLGAAELARRKGIS